MCLFSIKRSLKEHNITTTGNKNKGYVLSGNGKNMQVKTLSEEILNDALKYFAETKEPVIQNDTINNLSTTNRNDVNMKKFLFGRSLDVFGDGQVYYKGGELERGDSIPIENIYGFHSFDETFDDDCVFEPLETLSDLQPCKQHLLTREPTEEAQLIDINYVSSRYDVYVVEAKTQEEALKLINNGDCTLIDTRYYDIDNGAVFNSDEFVAGCSGDYNHEIDDDYDYPELEGMLFRSQAHLLQAMDDVKSGKFKCY